MDELLGIALEALGPLVPEDLLDQLPRWAEVVICVALLLFVAWIAWPVARDLGFL